MSLFVPKLLDDEIAFKKFSEFDFLATSSNVTLL